MTGPRSFAWLGQPSVLLDANNRKALQRISETASSILLDADMPTDPEDED